MSHDRTKAMFLAALERPPEDRRRFLFEACGDDETLRIEVESLLAFHDEDAAGAEHPDGDDDAQTFAPGFVYAGRYRMVSRIGRGGMGEVWRADDLVLGTPVALKLIHSSSAAARERVLNEVRLARQITHPAVCRVFDVGDSDGRVFFSMELVQGEDLAALVRLAGRLPSDRVLDIALQLCNGLAAAHARGVLHRDLKPANILVDDEGRVRITDFGIAVVRTDATHHTLIGTPGYMAPEQQTQGTALSEQTDVYALGLVLYELLVGRHPWTAAPPGRALPRPSTLVQDVDPVLEKIVMQAIAERPHDRPASADAMAAALQSARSTAAPRPANTRRWWMVSAAAAALVVLGAAIWMAIRPVSGQSLNAQDTIVLADFVNTTGESVFDGALKVALSVALEQSPFLKVFADDRVRDTLRLMERPPDTAVTRAIAREVARREQLKALLAASIAKLGSHYVLTLEAVNAETGDVMAREQGEASSQEEVLGTLGGVAARMREKLGESLASVQRFGVALPQATTASLEALHAYALALEDGRLNPRPESIPQLKRAIELDPDFAMALAMLSGMYANLGQSGLAPVLSRRAFELRDRVSERERFYISWRYYRDATQSWDKGLELARSWVTTYPREGPAFNSLGFASVTLGQYEAAIAPLEEAIRLDPKNFAPPENLGVALVALGRLDDAKRVLREARARQRFFFAQARVSYLIGLLEGDANARQQVLQEALAQPEPTSAANWAARASAFAGRIGTAHEEFRRGIRTVLASRLDEVAAHYATQDAESHALVGQCDAARAEVAEGLTLSRDNFTRERGSRALALCGATADAERLLDELARDLPDATLTTHVARPITAAMLALARNNPSRALTELEAVHPYDHVPAAELWPSYLRGEAYLRVKDGTRAAAAFTEAIERRNTAPDSILYPLAHLGLARAAALSGDPAARTRYDQFFKVWPTADANLKPMVEARQEYATLK